MAPPCGKEKDGTPDDCVGAVAPQSSAEAASALWRKGTFVSSTIAIHGSVDGDSRSVWDKRVSTRVAAYFPVKLYLEGLPGPLAARSRDVGPGGICVGTRSPFALSSVQRVAIELPSGPLVLAAEGRWQREIAAEHAMVSGIQFMDPPRAETFTISKFVRDRASELAQFMQEHSDLAGLDVDCAMDLALFTRLREVPAGHRLYCQGKRSDGGESIFVVYRGSVALEVAVDGDDRVRLERVEAGGVFGGLPLVAGVPHVESASTETDSLLLEIDPYTFHFLEWAKPPLARGLTQIVIRKQVLHLSNLITRLAGKSVET